MAKKTKQIKSVTMINCSICGEGYAIAMPTRGPWSNDTQIPITSGICNKCQKIIDTKFCWLLCEDEELEPQMSVYTEYEIAWAVMYKHPDVIKILKAGGIRLPMEVWLTIGLPLTKINNIKSF